MAQWWLEGPLGFFADRYRYIEREHSQCDRPTRCLSEPIAHRYCCRAVSSRFRSVPEKPGSDVPDYLSQTPFDLYDQANGQPPLRYRVSEDGSSYRVYSVGINGIHENGVLVENDFYAEGDYDLALMFGDRLKENQKVFDEYQKFKSEEAAIYDDDPFFDDDSEDYPGDWFPDDIENEGADELKHQDSSDEDQIESL